MSTRPSPLMTQLLPIGFVALVVLNIGAAFTAFVLGVGWVSWIFLGLAAAWGVAWSFVLLRVIGPRR